MEHSNILQSRVRQNPSRKIAPVDAEIENEDDASDVWSTRMPTSARRYQGIGDVKTDSGRLRADVQNVSGPLRGSRKASTERQAAIPARRTATQVPVPLPQASKRKVATTEEAITHPGSSLSLRKILHTRPHWLVLVGVGLLVMIFGWIALSALTNWWQVTQDDWHYGRPRTYQTDYVVGHNDSLTNPSHFIAINLNRHVEVIEFPGGDSTKVKIYLGPVLLGQGQDLTPVTLSFKDVNGDGKVDLIVNVQDSHFVFINDNGAFRPVRPGENIKV